MGGGCGLPSTDVRLRIRSRLLQFTQTEIIPTIAARKPISIPQPRAILSLTLYPLPPSPDVGLEEEVVGADITATGELFVDIATAVPFAMIVTGVGMELMANALSP